MPFQKGFAKAGPGRPQGSKNKNYMNPVYWFNLIQEESEDMSSDKKVEIAFKALDLLMPKVQNLPASPDESVSNADRVFDELKAAEEYGLNRNAGSASTQPGSNGADVETGSAQSEITA
jgi:hypothetical protein